MASIIGAENLVGPFHSPLAVFSGSPPTEDEKSRAVDVLRQAAEFAATAKVRLCIEYLNRFECYFLTTAADAVALGASRQSSELQNDVRHISRPHRRKKPDGRDLQVAPVMGQVHISENDRGTPGTGQVAWDEVFYTLKKVGYDGWLVIEAFGRAASRVGRCHARLARLVSGRGAGLSEWAGVYPREMERIEPVLARAGPKPITPLT